ncbi:MAG: glycosyltransferase [Bacteroides sp.]|nr:glycosyltransferase [Bacteroides sp.]MCM1414248.1 glycosyltransferase [Bacteroides sp.]MCM1471217.1 glycosyltransferase [Bacteroides sp.]
MERTCKYKTLVMVTDAYPFGGVTEKMFVEPELQFLSQTFQNVIIVPTIALGQSVASSLPDNVTISRWWVDSPDWRLKWFRARHLFSPKVWRGVRGHFNFSSLSYAVAAHAFSKELARWVHRENIETQSTLFYTFWFDFPASGLALICEQNKVNYISRAHLHDFYMDRARPLRRLTVERSQGVFVAGRKGADYLQALYPHCAAKIEQSRLGSRKSDRQIIASHHEKQDNALTFLSVARVTDVKRVDLNFRMLRALAVGRPSTNIKWIHVGDGPEMDALKTLVARDCLFNLTIDLRGALDNDDVHKIYATEKLDWFMLLSRREGLPVAVCEALSYGVPVVATDVEGSQEAVDDCCGLILASDPEPEEFVRGIVPYLDSDIRMNRLREGAFAKWETEFDSDKLRAAFVKKISHI